MTLLNILMAFAGGIFGALVSGTISFVLTGIIAFIAIAVILSGGGDAIMNDVVFGAFFGPHIAFAGGVAAAAVAGRQNGTNRPAVGEETYSEVEPDLVKTIAGNDINTPIFGTKNSLALIVGGLFGVIGFIINELLVSFSVPVDTVATTIVICGLATRLLIGGDSIIAKREVENNLVFDLIWAFAISLLTAHLVGLTGIDNFGWAISAFTLIFLFTSSSNFPATHHVTMVVGHAMLAYQNIWIATIFGLGAVVLGHYVDQYTNTDMETHIDMPAVVIMIGSLLAIPFG